MNLHSDFVNVSIAELNVQSDSTTKSSNHRFDYPRIFNDETTQRCGNIQF